MSTQISERPKYKLTVVGDQRTGKTSLITRFNYDTFNEEYQETIGVDFVSKTMHLENRALQLQFWDTAGQERFRALVPVYLSSAALVLIVVDTTQKSSYDSLPEWIEIAREHNRDCPIMIVANKSDLQDKQVISMKKLESFATKNGVSNVIQTSAKTSFNVKAVLHRCCELLPRASVEQLKESQPRRLDYAQLELQIAALKQHHPDDERVRKIAGILSNGLKDSNPQGYFNQQFQETDFEGEDSLQDLINQLAWTKPSLCNTVLNVIVTVLLAASIIGLPLAYCLNLLEANKKASGHSLMFFRFGEKQLAKSVTNQVLEEIGMTHRV